ncbi:probable proline--tRNA ligase, mitochondrial [Aricia agestis]|uniref:probable proline--tRNA ligase, mitochondrial n=1 Tax=Aricia agestis TaxID=91739 RepID=UPI001C20AE8D|nr:probable proline--tRNA ligase, mitochondrial [Aricia agestis]
MRLISKTFQPLITIPKGAKIKNTDITCKSQKLLLENGLLRPTSSGFFTLLPLARRVLNKLEHIIHQQMDFVGAQRISLPNLTSSKLWETSGRLNAIGPELIKVEDRHGKKYLLAPTHEEAISELLADVGPVSHKQLPLLVYQISNKYRDEHRPKHGLLRSREFSMLDAYSLHQDHDTAAITYDRFTDAYRHIFDKLDLPVYRVEAPTGDMGGTISHEWQLTAAAGEDAIKLCSSCSHTELADGNSQCSQCGKETKQINSIEVGHTFILGTKYSESLKANFVESHGTQVPLTMACYGIGITRLLAASLEALSSETAMRWPRAIAPYSAIVIGPKEGSKEWAHHDFEKVLEVSIRISEAGLEDDVVVDDRHALTIGKRMMMADRMGYPYIIVCGRSTLESPSRYELYQTHLQQSKPQLLTLSELITAITDSRGEEKISVRG